PSGECKTYKTMGPELMEFYERARAEPQSANDSSTGREAGLTESRRLVHESSVLRAHVSDRGAARVRGMRGKFSCRALRMEGRRHGAQALPGRQVCLWARSVSADLFRGRLGLLQVVHDGPGLEAQRGGRRRASGEADRKHDLYE